MRTEIVVHTLCIQCNQHVLVIQDQDDEISVVDAERRPSTCPNDVDGLHDVR